MNQFKIESQIFLKDDLHNILRSLALLPLGGEYGDGFRAALVAVATATGMEQEQEPRLLPIYQGFAKKEGYDASDNDRSIRRTACQNAGW